MPDGSATEGVTVDDEITGTEDTDVSPAEGTESAEEFDAGGDEVGAAEDLDPWEALKAKGYDPNALDKTFTRFTQELESVKDKERELAAKYEPYKELEQLLESDPRYAERLQRALTDPFEDSDPAEDALRRVSSLENQLFMERQFSALDNYVKSEGYPEPDKDALMRFAAQKGIADFQDAYNAMYVKEIAKREADKVVEGIKKSKGAAAVQQTASGDKAKTQFTQAEISKMSKEELKANYPAILAQYRK